MNFVVDINPSLFITSSFCFLKNIITLMTADILQREGLEPVKYASSDRLIINYEKGMIGKDVQIYWT